MVISQIQLGVKKGSEAYRDWLPSQGFFYGEQVDEKPKAMYVRTINPARQHLIFSTTIQAKKEIAGCTNILQTGALPTVRGEGQRLRKGFQYVSVGVATSRACHRQTCRRMISRRDLMLIVARSHPESLSSAAANKAPSEKYDVMIDKPLR